MLDGILENLPDFKPFADYNSDLNRIEFLTQDTTVITEFYNKDIDVLYNLDGDVVGFNIHDPMNFIKSVMQNKVNDNGE